MALETVVRYLLVGTNPLQGIADAIGDDDAFVEDVVVDGVAGDVIRRRRAVVVEVHRDGAGIAGHGIEQAIRTVDGDIARVADDIRVDVNKAIFDLDVVGPDLEKFGVRLRARLKMQTLDDRSGTADIDPVVGAKVILVTRDDGCTERLCIRGRRDGRAIGLHTLQR